MHIGTAFSISPQAGAYTTKLPDYFFLDYPFPLSCRCVYSERCFFLLAFGLHTTGPGYRFFSNKHGIAFGAGPGRITLERVDKASRL